MNAVGGGVVRLVFFFVSCTRNSAIVPPSHRRPCAHGVCSSFCVQLPWTHCKRARVLSECGAVSLSPPSLLRVLHRESTQLIHNLLHDARLLLVQALLDGGLGVAARAEREKRAITLKPIFIKCTPLLQYPLQNKGPFKLAGQPSDSTCATPTLARSDTTGSDSGSVPEGGANCAINPSKLLAYTSFFSSLHPSGHSVLPGRST